MDGLQSVRSFLSRLDVVVLVVREAVAEPLVVDPLLPQAEVEHGEGGVARHLLVHIEELGQPLVELLVGEGGVGLQEHQPPTPGVAGLLVDVQLEVLVVVHEAPPGLVDGEVARVLLVEEVGVLPVVDGRLHLDDLAAHLFPDGVDVGELTQPASLPQPALHSSAGSLQVVVSDLPQHPSVTQPCPPLLSLHSPQNL